MTLTRQYLTDRPPVDDDLTLIVDGNQIDGNHFDGLEWIQGPAGHQAEPSGPDLGPGYEEPWGDQRPTEADFRFGHRPQHGTWMADNNLGHRAAIPDHPGYIQHFGSPEPWGPELTNDREAITGRAGPWDAELQVPLTAQRFRV